ncbi:MAG TPA: NPCBM/NEW2 domain-containing protein [Vicinamibacterales bacterium]|nr:NPCBM/NEW2 domain-containing protein [Vicinamibacterales bacterium]
MSTRSLGTVGALLAWGGLAVFSDQAPLRKTTASAGPVSAWPQPIPVRLKPPAGDGVLVTTLGDVTTPLANGTFDPVADRVTTTDGRTLEDYFRKTLEIPFYAPIDKSRFAVPPSGWCSWYYYYQEITPEEVLANAQWVARHLAPYGARYVQVDDGWQGSGHGLGSNRDWTTVDVRFGQLGMDGLAKAIRDLGLEAGIWLAPHGQSNERVARESNAFTWKADGTTASDSWEGTYLLDPTAPAARDYLLDLFKRLRSWGYTYFKIDGQPTVLREMARALPHMVGPAPPGDADTAAAELYRRTLSIIREAIGPESFLLTSWGIALPAMGQVNGARSAGDVVQGWEGFLTAASAAQQWNFLHNIAWYADPDVLEVRPPLTDGMARAWATIFALTGQALLASDRLTDLPEPRIEILRRVYPAIDIRPLDLFRPEDPLKPLVDLKVSHLGRQYDVVGIFNYDAAQATTRRVSWSEIGLDPLVPHHVYDFWSGTYLGAWENGVFVDVPPADVRVLTLVRSVDRPVLVSTSRHISQGWVDLLELKSGGTADRPTIAGRSRLIAGDAYRMIVGMPRAAPTYALAAARARGEIGPVEVTWLGHQGYATVTLRSTSTQEVGWDLAFERAQPYVFPVESPNQVVATARSLAQAAVRWPAQYHVKAGYLVELDGAPQGVSFAPGVVLRGLSADRPHRIAVRSIWYDGSTAAKPAETTLTIRVPDAVHLSDLEPAVARHLGGNSWRMIGRDRSTDGGPLRSAGRTFEKGLGTHSTSEIRYEIAGAFARFLALAAIDDEVRPQKPNEARFEVWGDGRLLWKSEAIRSGEAPVPIEADVTGVRDLTLKVLPGSDGSGSDHADWLDARLIKQPSR